MNTKKSFKTTSLRYTTPWQAENTESTEKVKKDSFTGKIIGCAMEVHRNLGPGLLESTYQQCLARELAMKNIKFSLEHPLPVEYKGVRLDCGYRIDILVESNDVPCRLLIVELKSVEEIKEIHRAQLLTYMKLSNIKTGLLINFNVHPVKSCYAGIPMYRDYFTG